MIKKIFSAIIISSLLVCGGCDNSNDDVNISEWMFSDDLDPFKCISILGSSVENDFKEYLWEDYELVNGYKGTLALFDIQDQDFFSTNENRKSYSFHWTIQCDESDYSKIINKLKSYEYIQKTVDGTGFEEGDVSLNFITNFEDKNYNPKYLNSGEKAYFSILSIYNKEILELQWRENRKTIKS